MKLEEDRFVRIEDLGTHKVVVMLGGYIGHDAPGLLPGEYRLNEESIRGQITNLKRDGHPTDQSEAALKALETANREENDESTRAS